MRRLVTAATTPRVRRIAVALNAVEERRARVGVRARLFATAGNTCSDVEGGVGGVRLVAVKDCGGDCGGPVA